MMTTASSGRNFNPQRLREETQLFVAYPAASHPALTAAGRNLYIRSAGRFSLGIHKFLSRGCVGRARRICGA
jgi:hypothetical protein